MVFSQYSIKYQQEERDRVKERAYKMSACQQETNVFTKYRRGRQTTELNNFLRTKTESLLFFSVALSFSLSPFYTSVSVSLSNQAALAEY